MVELILLLLIILILLLLLSFREKTRELSIKVNGLETNLQQKVENSVIKTIQNSAHVFESLITSAISKNTEVIKGAFATSLKELGIQEDLGKLKEASNDLKSITSDLKSMFEIKTSRAKFGELQLESLLKDLFPPNRLRFQENIGHGVPDACIIVEGNRSLCIDSKFPLENYRRYCEAENAENKDQYWKDFIRDVKKHFEEIRSKYVGKENTESFAFMFVPSDAIYYHLVSEAPEIVVEASKSGVILTSPSTLPAQLSLISAKIKAEEISKSAEEIQRKIDSLGGYLEDLESKLETLFRHVNNAYSNVPKVQQSFTNLKTYYSSLSSIRDLEGENEF